MQLYILVEPLKSIKVRLTVGVKSNINYPQAGDLNITSIFLITSSSSDSLDFGGFATS